jgi:uncharacterized protein YjiS (DUF1127 family)
MQHALGGLLRLLAWLKPAVIAAAIRRGQIACARRRSRLNGLASLHAMSDYELRDIGLARSAIMAAAWMEDEKATLLAGRCPVQTLLPSEPGGGVDPLEFLQRQDRVGE